MSPFLCLLGNSDSSLSSLSLKGDIYPDDKSVINFQWIDVLGFSDRKARAATHQAANREHNPGNSLKKNVISFLARSLLLLLRGSFSCL